MKFHIAYLLALTMLAACGKHPDDARNDSTAIEADYRPIPGTGSDGSCLSIYEPASIAAWAEAVDGLVVAQVIGVDPFTSPARVALTNADPPFVDGENCTGALEPGVVLTLGERHVERVSGGLPQVREVVLGHQIMGNWEARPILTEGELQWWPPGSGGIRPGQILGFALRYDDVHAKWTTAGLPIFQLDERGNLVYPDGESCLRPPADHSDIDLRGYRRALDERSDDFEADVAAARGFLSWPDEDSRLATWFSAACIVPDVRPDPDGTCQSQVDCSAPNICVDGSCVHDPNVVRE